jgi:hypothetical protein
MEHVIYFLLCIWWLCGLVIIKGFWLTVLGVIVPPYAMYVCLEHLLKMFGAA